MAELRGLRGVGVDALTGLAEAVFGRGDRAPGWLTRKLVREGVDPDLSVLAVAPGSPEHVSEDMLWGYFLIGREPGDPVAQTAGLAVHPERRGRGLARALADEAVTRLAATTPCTTLRALAEPDREELYRRLGFTVHARRVTLLAHGTCPISPVPGDWLARAPARPWSPSPTPALEICAWRAGAWERTPPAETATLTPIAGVSAHVSREGRAVLVQRLLVAPGLDPLHAIEALRAEVPEGTPLLLYGMDPVSSITGILLQRGYQAVQRFAAVDRPVRACLDNAHAGDR